MIPTLRTLSRVCSVYGVSLSHSFTDLKRHSLSITRKGHISAIRRSQDTFTYTGWFTSSGGCISVGFGKAD